MTNLSPFEAVLCTEQLKFRGHRTPDFEVESRMLAQMIEALSDSPAGILQQLAEIMLRNFNVGSAGFSIHSRKSEKSWFRWAAIAGKWSPFFGGDTSQESSLGRDIFNCTTPLLFRKLRWRNPAFPQLSPTAEECLLVPFRVRDKIHGAIWPVDHDGNQQFDSESVRQLMSVSHFAAAAYQLIIASEIMLEMNGALLLGSLSQSALAETADQLNVQLREEITRRKNAEDHLIDEANRDKLTTLLNRRAYDEIIMEAYQRLQRNGETMGLIAVDVDHFKKINDTYGHQTGDEVLKEVAIVLVDSVRTIDKVFRVGGEEFCVLLPGADQTAAVAAAERLRTAVELKAINTEYGNIRVTLSLGLSVALHISHTPEKLGKSADLALYQAKAQGRNIVITAELSHE